MDSANQLTPEIPDYTLVRRIGRGSYGEVWLARTVLGQYRAIKIIRRDRFKTDKPFERELAGIRRFEPVSRTHPGFLDILHAGVGQEGNLFYCVMELADDLTAGQQFDPDHYVAKTLSTELEIRNRLSVQECVRIALALTDALVHLHKYGLVHRDIKPSNVIFVEGAAKLGDIGLVALVDEKQSYVGTEGFIPPEGPGTVQGDIFSLGKVLYEAATGNDRNDFPKLPTALCDYEDMPEFMEFNEIILRACYGDPAKRYRTAGEMLADLVVLQNGKSVRRLRLLERRFTVYRRAAAAILAAGLFIAPVYYFAHEQQRRASALAAREREVRERDVGGLVARALRSTEGGDLLGSIPPLISALELGLDQRDEALQRLRLGMALSHAPRLTALAALNRRINWVELHPQGGMAAAEFFGKLHFLNADGTSRLVIDPGAGLISAVFDPSAETILTAAATGDVTAWNWPTGKKLQTYHHKHYVHSVALNPAGDQLVTGAQDGTVYVWKREPPALLQVLKGHSNAVLHACFSPNGQVIASGSRDGTVRLWNAQTGAPLHPPFIDGSWVYHVAFSPDGTRVVSASYNRFAKIWKTDGSGSPLQFKHDDAVMRAEFSPDGRFLLSASTDGTVRLWDLFSVQPPCNPILYHSHRVVHAAFSRDGRQIVSACADGTVRAWDLAPLSQLPAFEARIYSTGGARSCARNGAALEVFGNGGEIVARIKPPEEVDRVRFDSTGTALITSESGGAVERIYELPGGQELSRLRNLVRSNDLVAFIAPPGEMLIGRGATVEAHNARTGELLWTVKAPGLINDIVPAPGRDLFLCVAEKRVELRRLTTGIPSIPPISAAGDVTRVEFSPNGKLFLIATSDENLTEHATEIRSVETGRLVRPRLFHRDGVLFASFSPDGKRLVTCGEDRQAIIWDIATLRSRLLPHEDYVRFARFSPDGKWLVTVAGREFGRVWDVESGQLVSGPFRTFTAGAKPSICENPLRIVWERDSCTSFTMALSAETRDISELSLISRLLAGNQSQIRNNGVSSLGKAWSLCAARWPAGFRVTGEEQQRWEEWCEKVAKEEGNAFAGAFHRDLALRPRTIAAPAAAGSF